MGNSFLPLNFIAKSQTKLFNQALPHPHWEQLGLSREWGWSGRAPWSCATTVGFSDVGPGEKVDPSCSLCEQLCSSRGCSPAGAQSSWFGWQIISPGLFITEVSLKHPQRDPSRLSKQKLFFFLIQLCKSLGVMVSCFLWSLAQTWLFLCSPSAFGYFLSSSLWRSGSLAWMHLMLWCCSYWSEEVWGVLALWSCCVWTVWYASTSKTNIQIHTAMQACIFHKLLQFPVVASALAGVLMAIFDCFSVTLIFCLSWSCW